MITEHLPPTSTRVERMTRPGINTRIRTRTNKRIAALAKGDAAALDARIRDVEREWDVERVLQANASSLVLLGTLLGARVDRRFLLLPVAVLAFFGLHAIQGWCPPVPVFRRRGIRTVREIERERYALKALRGDFDDVPEPERDAGSVRIRSVLEAVDR